MSVKTYVLLGNMDADAPVYQITPDGKRVQIKKILVHRPTLRQNFQDENGVGRVIRYKNTARSIYQDEQIEKEKIPANERFTTNEFRDLEFKFGVLVTPKTFAQTYLEAHPEFEGFKGICDDVSAPRYKLLDEAAESKIKNTETRKRVKAANKIFDLNLEEAQAMLIRLNGSYFKTPSELEECQNLLIAFVDDAEEKGLDAVMKEDNQVTVDEKTKMLIGKLMNESLLSFDAVQGNISRKGTDDKWITIREMSDEYSLEERMRLFSDFLNTEDGKPLRLDLEKLAGTEKKRVGRPPNTPNV